jgi:hypothetical protein
LEESRIENTTHVHTAEIAKELDGEVIGDGSLELTGFAPATAARAGDLTFAENETFFQKAEQSAAAAILIDGPFTSAHKPLIRVANARIAFARVLPLFFPERAFAPGVHPSAVVDPSAQIDPTAHIGPHCVIGEKSKSAPASCCKAAITSDAIPSSAPNRGFSPTSSFTIKHKLASACAFTPARSLAPTVSAMFSTPACIAKCRKSAGHRAGRRGNRRQRDH